MSQSLPKSPGNHLAKLVLEHLQRVDVISPPSSPSQNYSKALEAAKDFDLVLSLTPSKTLVEQRPMVIPPKPVTYVHRRPDTYTNAIVARDDSNRAQKAALRVFLDAFYYKCGFRTWYQNPNYIAGMNPFYNFSDFKGRNAQRYTQDERKRYVRYDAVMNALPRIPKMTKRDARYLVGRLAGRDKLHDAHHQLGVRAMAVHLERLSKKWTEERKVAVLKAFTWLTDYPNYPCAYNNEGEERQFTDRGVLPAHSDDIPDGIDMEDEEEWDALMREVSIRSVVLLTYSGKLMVS